MNCKKIVLVIPNIKWNSKNINTDWTIWPLSLCIFASILEPDYEVDIIDANIEDMSIENFINKISVANPFAVGISIFSDDFSESGHIAATFIKQLNPEITIIAGGSYIIINPDVASLDKNIDYFVIGEGEYVLRGILDFLTNRNNALPDKGILFRRDGRMINFGKAELIKDLDELPLPAYHKIDFALYANLEHRQSAFRPDVFPYGRILTSRGCPLNCVYCQNKAIHGRRIRYRSPKVVLSEVEWLIRQYQIKSLLIDDANFTANKKRAKEIVRGFIDRDFNLKWKAMNLAVFTLDSDLLELMAQSNCSYIDLAIESGVPRVLKEIIHKPVNLDHVLQIIQKAKELNFQISANFIIGFPGESWDEIRQTIQFAERIDLDYIKIMVAMPLRHTDLYDIANNGGYLRKDFDFLNMRWGIGEISTNEFSSIDTTILRAYEWDRINFSSKEKRERAMKLLGINSEELGLLRAKSRNNLFENMKDYFRSKTLSN